MTANERKKYRVEELSKNLDVLFRIYCTGRLHVLLFRPSSPDEWRRVIRENITTGPSFQLNTTRVVNGDFPIINISGREPELETICKRFVELHNMVIHNIQVARAQQDETEELRARVEELELENNRLRGQLLDVRTRMHPPELYNELRENIQHGGAAQMNRAAEIEEINVEITELEQEISVLYRQLIKHPGEVRSPSMNYNSPSP
ncbi:uncharacterized protein LOC132887591 [Neoarius graeffei]|uniref:uncharacterized protein LOC132887591 n=1 Tax=Neoarius graeffei TaxID=443677 RepID=UPI00298CE446|nr:uncharacterized protein LOC132887591 [Neoarius graeffei]